VNVQAVNVGSTTATSTTTTEQSTPTADTVTGGNNSTNVGSSGGGGSSSGGWKSSGDATYYGIGLGACGWTNHEPDLIAAVSHAMFDSFATTEAEKNDSNLNPICGRMATAYLAGHGTVTVKIVDKCMGCNITGSLDFSMAAFNKLTNFGAGCRAIPQHAVEVGVGTPHTILTLDASSAWTRHISPTDSLSVCDGLSRSWSLFFLSLARFPVVPCTYDDRALCTQSCFPSFAAVRDGQKNE